MPVDVKKGAWTPVLEKINPLVETVDAVKVVAVSVPMVDAPDTESVPLLLILVTFNAPSVLVPAVIVPELLMLVAVNAPIVVVVATSVLLPVIAPPTTRFFWKLPPPATCIVPFRLVVLWVVPIRNN